MRQQDTKLNILLADQEQSTLDLVKKRLCSEGRAVFIATSAEAEIESKASKIGIVLDMPKPLDLGPRERAMTKGIEDARSCTG